MCGGHDNGRGISQVLCVCHQHRATKPSCSYSIHLPTMSHDLGNLIKTQSHFKVRVMPWWQMACKIQKPFASDFEKFGSIGQLTWTKLSLHINA
jgi:hypothetical protein